MVTIAGPLPSRPTNARRVRSGHGVVGPRRSACTWSASTARARRLSGTPRREAAPAMRRGNDWSRGEPAAASSTMSSSSSTIAAPGIGSGRACCRRVTVRPLCTRSTRLQNRPPAQSMARAAADTRRISTSASPRALGTRIARATASCSWSMNTLPGRPVTRCSSQRTAYSTPAGPSSSSSGASSAAITSSRPVATAQCSTSRSRSPPRPSFRFGFEQRAHLAGARPALLALGEQQPQPVQRALAPLHAARRRRRRARRRGRRRAGARRGSTSP